MGQGSLEIMFAQKLWIADFKETWQIFVWASEVSKCRIYARLRKLTQPLMTPTKCGWWKIILRHTF